MEYVRQVSHQSQFTCVIYRIPADIAFQDNFSHEQIYELLFSLSDEKLDRLCPLLDLVIGMPLSITHNVDKNANVVNGSVFFLLSVNFDESTSFTNVFDPYYETTVKIPSSTPQSLLIKSMRDNTVYELKTLKSKKWCTIQISPFRRYSIKLTQFPCVCAIGSSIYKVQGDTLNSMVVDSWWSYTAADSPQQGYVIVSRVRTRYSMVTLQLLTKDITEKFKVPKELLQLEKELHELSLKNISLYK